MSGKDVVILGDSNLCADKWNHESYFNKELATMVQDFLLQQASQQIVKEPTRLELVRGNLLKSCIDHCYTDVREKINGPFVDAVGDSDHLSVRILKYCRTPVIRPQAIKIRVYKNFSVGGFLTDIYNSNINAKVCSHLEIDKAAETFQHKFKEILDYYAPVRTIQHRRNYCPYLSNETKEILKERNILQKEASISGDAILLQEFKIKAREAKKAVMKDKRLGQQISLSKSVSSKQAWKSARSILGMNSTLAPTAIKDLDGNLTTNPAKLSVLFNEFFTEKTKKLRAKTKAAPKIDPVDRVQKWIDSKEVSPPVFSLKPITRQKLRQLIKQMKGGRSTGVDFIDSYSLKLAAPLLKDSLLHLINLSIQSSKFSAFWKPQLIFPQHKKSDKTSIENYRPVSHLVEIGKLVEHVVNEQVVQHFIVNGLFHKNHHGGVPHHSTDTALIQLYDMFLQSAQEKKLTAALL